MIEAKAVVWYALGDSAESILFSLDYSSTPVSRATLYRTLRSADDGTLRQLHGLNRRLRSAGRRRPIRFFQGSEMPVFEGGFAEAISAPAYVVDDRSEYGEAAVVIRWVALVFNVYASSTMNRSLEWIDQYLRGLSQAAVLSYRTRRQLDAAFRPEEPIPYLGNGDDLVVSRRKLEGRLDISLPPVRNAVASALRIVDFPSATLDSAFEHGAKMRGKGRFMHLGDVDLADIHEGAPSVTQHGTPS